MILRDYQERGVADIRTAIACGARRVLYQLPTGGGKTAVLTAVALGAARKQRRILVIAHRRELIEQASRKLTESGVAHGIIAPWAPQIPALRSLPTQVGSIQTIARREVEPPDMVILDECHHATSDSYRSVLSRWPSAYVLGVTATPQRLDGRGLSSVFQALVCGPSVRDLIDAGYLARYEYLAPSSSIDLSEIRTIAGDYAHGELEGALDRPTITGDAATHYGRYLAGRPAIAFCVSVAHAEHVAEQFRAAGYRAASVDGSLDARERHDRIAAIGDGRLQVLTSCDLISEGLDVPSVAGAILLRPTKSLALHLQQIGRVLRPKADGSAAIILDHAGNVSRHGLPDEPREWTLDGRAGHGAAPRTRRCDTCFRVFLGAGAAVCERDGCPMRQVRETETREQPEQESGELVAVDAATIAAARASARAEVARATSWGELERIRIARGYKPGWTRFVMQARSRRSVA